MKDKISNKKEKKIQENKKRVEEKVIINLFGENDMNIYIFNKVGILIGLALSAYFIVYFYL